MNIENILKPFINKFETICINSDLAMDKKVINKTRNLITDETKKTYNLSHKNTIQLIKEKVEFLGKGRSDEWREDLYQRGRNSMRQNILNILEEYEDIK